MSVRAVQVVLVGSWLASCTAHGEPSEHEGIGEITKVEAVEPDDFAWLAEVEPPSLDGFDAAGTWRRTALFESRPGSFRRVEFVVVDGEPIRQRSLVFEDDRVIAVVDPEQVEYRRWRTDMGSRFVVFERYADRLVRIARTYKAGEPLDRFDTFAATPVPVPVPK